ncbi:NACHT domain-containing protein [Planktothrix paucivesiculata]|uniref:NACHT domain-containing protein n=1 Tax=Planktothrix paucivesiculata TaxID=1678308 RepID=UPI0012DC5D54|nr:hypothetical protein [Planktothrix paucivesiculata]
MSDPRYDWKRFWYPKGGTCKLDFAGYLDDPESSYAHITNPEVVPFEAISRTPCLILLGEPGGGKSLALEQAFEDAKRQGKPALKFELRGFDSSSELRNEIFGNSVFQDWLNSTYHLDLFLDSLDEGLLSLSVLSDTLSRKLKNFPCERLKLRLTCRTADWRGTLEENLRQIWGKDDVGVYELAPLRRVDVEEAAGKNHLAPIAFLEEIRAREAVPLAIQPITLKFLLKIYQEDKQFPSTRKELYYKGCWNFCNENNPYRREVEEKGKLDIDKRMMIAGRIAAVIIFANRVAIWTGSGEAPSKNYIAIQELCGLETLDEREFSVTETAIEEVLKITSLFSSYGDGHNSFCFAHQTYAEFLAARYLAQHSMTLAQTMSLLKHPADPDRKLVPQLHEVAAWLASLVPDVFREIVESEPDVMLHSDIAMADQDSCVALVESLLRLHDEEKLLYEPRSWLYQRLKDKNLVDQVQPYITDTTKSVDARYVAIDIVKTCQLKSFQHDLVNIALDPSQPYLVRVNAAHTVSELGDTEIKAKLKSLALGEAGDDPNNELKGYGLQATYPSHITAKEVFDVLTQPDGDYFGGTYQNFVARDFAAHLQVADLPLALAWVEAQQPRRELSYPFSDLSDAIMFLAWEHLESPGILGSFAKIVFTKWNNYRERMTYQNRSLFKDSLLSDDYKRRLLIATLVPMFSLSERTPVWLLGLKLQVDLHKDFTWMIECLQSSEDERIQRTWVQLIGRVLITNPEHFPERVKTVLSIITKNTILRKAFEVWIEPIALDSSEAKIERKVDLEVLNQLEQEENLQSGVSPAVTIIQLLEKFESEDLSAWWQLNREMTLTTENQSYEHILKNPDLISFPGWKEATTSTRVRITEAAEKFVLNWEPREDELSLYEHEISGYKALRLLLIEVPNRVMNIPSHVWKRWAVTILSCYSISTSSQNSEIHHGLMKFAYQHASDRMISALLALINNENAEYFSTNFVSAFKECWNRNLTNALLNKLEDKNLKPRCMGHLLEELLLQKSSVAINFTRALIPSPPPSSEKDRFKAIQAASLLMTHTKEAGWSVVWPAIQQDSQFGEEVIEFLSNYLHRSRDFDWQLDEAEIAQLFIWLVTQSYKIEEGVQNDNSDEKTNSKNNVNKIIEDNALEWKNFILHHLKERGTNQSCKALQTIADGLPEMAEKLRHTLLEAQLITRRRTWSAPTPQEVLKVTSNRNLRLVNGADQLLDVVIESLNRLNQKLQGETPSAILLWDQVVSRPKDEQALSDYVKIHLEGDLRARGIIAKREVEIRRRQGGKDVAAPGERLDLQVDAFIRAPSGEIDDCVSIIIEVKGCWNLGLDTAMQTQLVDRYLKDNRCQHGLYLIGWFNCLQWDSKDSRKPPKLSIEEARQKFEAQAAELSKQGVKVKAVVLNTALR